MSRPILLLNCGSSSIKYQMIDVDTEEVTATGLVQKIGDVGRGSIDHAVDDGVYQLELPFLDHKHALEAVVAMFKQFGPPLDQAVAVGHRTVHGGQTFQRTTRINPTVITKLKDLADLAPLHNPPGVAGIEAAMVVLPNVPHVAVFDTAFFSDLPPEAYTYAIDHEIAIEYGVRKYGFHGTSHDYVSQLAAETLGKHRSDLKMIVLHLGNGASASAIDRGRPIDTSMGLTPLQGLVMGTRSGDVDPGMVAFLHRELGWDTEELDRFFNKRCGMLGLTGRTDMREVRALMDEGDQRAQLGIDVYVHRLVSYIGSYTALLGGLDTLVFTAGVGENADWIRERVVRRLEPFGMRLDDERNAVRSKDARVVSSDDSSVPVLVVPTNEELSMARQVGALIDDEL